MGEDFRSAVVFCQRYLSGSLVKERLAAACLLGVAASSRAVSQGNESGIVHCSNDLLTAHPHSPPATGSSSLWEVEFRQTRICLRPHGCPSPAPHQLLSQLYACC